jgi:lysophospholipid acyltransferase (LPLAT)-like uncharacterized protein
MNIHYHIGRLAAFILKPLFASYRYNIIFEDTQDKSILLPVHSFAHPLIYTFFHQHGFGLLPFFMEKKIVTIVSKSKDGSLLAGAMEFLGFLTVRGSSHRSGNEAFHGALDSLKQNYSVGIAVDGPKGPIYKVKHGAVTLSKRANLPIVPLSAKASHAFHLNKSWEKSFLPYPFAKITITVGKIGMYEVEELESVLVKLNLDQNL